MIDRTHTARRVALAVAVVLATTVAGASVAAAAQDDRVSFVDKALDEKDNDWSAIVGRMVARQVAEGSSYLAKLTADEDAAGNASTYATDLREEFNQEAAGLQRYGNERLNASTRRDVFRVCTHDQQGNSATVYIVANASGGAWNNTRAVRPSTFTDLNRSVDHNVSLDWFASRNADEELDQFGDQFVEADAAITGTYQAKMAAKYGDSVQSGLIGTPPADCPA